MKLTKKQKDRIFIIAMLAVPTIQFIVFWLLVNFGSFRLAFIDQYTEEFSLENFSRFFRQWKKDIELGGALKYAIQNTLISMCITNFVNMPLVIFTSYILFKKFYGHTFFRVVFYLPALVGTLIMAMMQAYCLDATGPIVQIGKALGIKWNFEVLQSGLLGNALSTRPTFFIIKLGISGATVLLITGALNRIPRDIFDCGKLEGIGIFREFYNIALPLIWSTIGIMWVMSFASGWGEYASTMLFTGGAYNTNTVGYYLMNTTLNATNGSENFNYPAAMGLLLTAFVAPLTIFLRWLAEKLVDPVEF